MTDEGGDKLARGRGFWFWALVSVGAVLLMRFILDPNGRGTLNLKWRESVLLSSGQTIEVKRHVRFKQHFMLGVRMMSGRLYQSASLDIIPRPVNFVPWNAPVQPLYLDRDSENGEWLVVGAVDGDIDFRSANGSPCPPHWMFRLRKGVWYVQALSPALLKRQPNLLMDVRLSDDGTFKGFFFQSAVATRKAGERRPTGSFPSGMAFVGEITRPTNVCNYDQAPRFRKEFFKSGPGNPINLAGFPRLPE